MTRQTMQWVNEHIVKRLLFYFKKSLFPFSNIIFSSIYIKGTLTCVLNTDLQIYLQCTLNYKFVQFPSSHFKVERSAALTERHFVR